MLTAVHALQVLLPLPYILSFIYYLRYFETDRAAYSKKAYLLLNTALFLHVLFLAVKWLAFRQFPVTNPAESLSLVAGTVAAVYVFLEKLSGESKTGVFFLGLSASAQMFASMFMPLQPIHSELLANPVFAVHTFVTVTGLSGLAVAALYGLMYIMLSQKLRQHRFGHIYENLPDLETLEMMGRKSSLIGLLFLGAGIVMGHIWAGRILNDPFPLDPKIIVTDAAWILYVIMWVVVRNGNLRGLQPGRWAFWGFIAMIVSLAAAGLVGDSFHNFNDMF